MTLDLLKLKVVIFLLKYNIKIGRKLSLYRAKYSAGKQVRQTAQNQKFDLRNMSDRMKNVLLYDQDAIDRRWAECEKCEFLTTNEKLGKTYNRCEKCGCFMKVGDNFVKIKVATASCPIGKWGKEYEFIKGKPTNGTQLVAK